MYRLHTAQAQKSIVLILFHSLLLLLIEGAMPVIFAYSDKVVTLRHRWHHFYTLSTTINAGHTDQPAQNNVTSASSKNQCSQRNCFLSCLFLPLNFFGISESGLAVRKAAHKTESSCWELCFIIIGQEDIFLCFPCLLSGVYSGMIFFQPFLVCKYTGSVELTWKTACLKSQEDCDLAWWYLRTTPFWYRLWCLKPGLGWILHISCCLLHCAMDSFYGTWGIKGGNQWVQWVSKGANFSFISEQSIASIKFLLAGMESLADFMNEPFDLFTLIVLTWAVWKISFTLGPRVSHEARPVGQFGHHSFTNFEHHFLMASIDEVCYANDIRKKHKKNILPVGSEDIVENGAWIHSMCSFGKSDRIPLSVSLPSHFGPHCPNRKWCSLGAAFFVLISSKNSNWEDNDFLWLFFHFGELPSLWKYLFWRRPRTLPDRRKLCF